MYALEEEPEEGNRWRRLGAGAVITATLLVGLGWGAQRFEPTRRLIQKVVQMTVVAEIPKVEKLPPPRTEPPPPPPKRAPPPPKSAAKTAAPPRADNPQPQSSEPVVGLEDGSFGSGDGASFQVGNTQMGEPVSVARAPATGPVAPAPVAPPKLIPAGVPPRVERCRYSSRAQKLGLEGTMIIEVDIDEKGRVTKADMRKPLEEELDQECLEAVRTARFEPATLGGNAVASTRFLRLRFELER
ncbi:MAG TPA: energy transducer TonB [Polyangiaceae bacterium]|nr:energy transducer TonB [Polyangiaceae bacterium]